MEKVTFPGRFSPLAGPIALVTTVDGEGRTNIAPKSWLGHVCREPDLFVLGCTRLHHTARNLLANGECVLNFPGDDIASRTWDAHQPLPPSHGEPAARGFTAIPACAVTPPRLQECRAHIEGRVESVKWYGDECVFFIEQVASSADEAVARAPDPYAVLRPIFFLGPGKYGVIERSQTVADAANGDDMVRYVIGLTPRAGVETPEALVRAHVAWLRELDAAGRLVLCGPFADGSGGMVILRAASLAEARTLAAADPFVRSGARDCQVRAWNLSNEANRHMGMAG
jgi:uncharacterized protein